jgi:hypothetical protein
MPFLYIAAPFLMLCMLLSGVFLYFKSRLLRLIQDVDKVLFRGAQGAKPHKYNREKLRGFSRCALKSCAFPAFLA